MPAAPDLFGILDGVKRLVAPVGLETAHVDGFSWARNGLTYGDSTKLTADDWNRVIANLRVVLIGSGVDLSTLDPANPALLKTVLQLYLGAAVVDILAGVDVGGYGMMPKSVYDANNDGIIDIAHGGTGANSSVDAADALSTASADIASATTTSLAAATGVAVRITGSATIESFGVVAEGAIRRLTFAGAVTLKHNATSLILPGAADIVAAAGASAEVQSLGGGNWRVNRFTRSTGAPIAFADNSIAFAKLVAAAIATAAEYQAGTAAAKLLTIDKVNAAMVEVALADAATIAWDMATGIDFTVMLGGNRTLGNPTNCVIGRRGRIRVVQDGTGGRTLTKSANHKTAAAGALTLSTAPNAVDYIDYDCRAANDIRLSVSRAWG